MKASVLRKPKAFYDKFERKGGAHLEATHYCPGCGHGNLHKIIAEALTDFEISDKTVFISPVGCSVFAYYYFDIGFKRVITILLLEIVLITYLNQLSQSFYDLNIYIIIFVYATIIMITFIIIFWEMISIKVRDIFA